MNENNIWSFLVEWQWGVQGHYQDTSWQWHWNFVNSMSNFGLCGIYLIQMEYDSPPTELMCLHSSEWNEILFWTIKPLQLLFRCVLPEWTTERGRKINVTIPFQWKCWGLEHSCNNHQMSKTHTLTKSVILVTFSIKELSQDIKETWLQTFSYNFKDLWKVTSRMK